MQVRINPWNENSKNEIETSLEYGAQYIMLPMWKTVDEVKNFLDIVNGRAKTILLLETKEAEECLDQVLKLDNLCEIHIGLNDLHLSYHLQFMFELLTNGTVERIVNKIKKRNIPFGFGGVSHLGDGIIPAEMIIAEHYRLGSTRAILSRGFCQVTPDYPTFKETFIKNLKDLREQEDKCALFTEKDFESNKQNIETIVKNYVEKKHE